MNKQRLQNVVRAVREGRNEDFNMSIYANHCGTPACALGHYAARGDLQEVFSLSSVNGDSFKIPVYNNTFTSIHTPFTVAAEHFDITIAETVELFSSSGCGKIGREPITAKQAIAYIENFITKHEVKEVVEELIQAREEVLV